MGSSYSWLSGRANHVFLKLPSADETVRRSGSMKYKFEFDADGPVLATVFLVWLSSTKPAKYRSSLTSVA